MKSYGSMPAAGASASLNWRTIRSLLPFLGAYRGRAAIAVACLLVAKVATVCVPLVLRDLVDALDVTPQNPIVVVPLALVIAYGGLRAVSTLARELQTTLFARVRHGIMRRIAQRVVGHLHGLSLRFHLERKTGAVARDIDRGTRSVSQLLNYLLFNIVPTVLELVMVSAILVTQYDVRFAYITVVAVALYGVFTFYMTQWRLKFRTAMNLADSRASSVAIDGLLNFETVKYFGNEEYELRRHNDALVDWEEAAVASQASLSILNVGQGIIIACAVTGILWLAAGRVVAGTMSLGDLVAVNAFMLQLFQPLGFLGTVYSILRHALNDMERMFELLAVEPEVRDRPDAGAMPVGAARVEFRNVHFAYQSDRPVLRGVSFCAEPGHKVAVVGASGGGKSTLARLLFRFYDVADGAIYINDVDIRDITQAALHDAMAVVPQDTVLFNESLLMNLRYARLDASDEEIAEALRMARLDAFVASLPDGLDTVVGERGLKLSGGEKQRVAIARAILKRPAIFIFDEATSALDTESEQAIMGALNEVARTRTTLMIAHRLSTIADADTILVMDDGGIAERGTHDSLMAAEGIYASLWRLQSAEQLEASA